MTEHMAIQDKLFAYLDGELDGATRDEVARHLDACGDCAHEMEITRRASHLFRAVQPQPLPEGFMERLQARIAQEAGPRPLDTAASPPAADALGGQTHAGSNGAVVPVRASTLPPTQLAPPSFQARSRRGPWRALMALAASLAVALGIVHFVLQPDGGANPALAPAALAYSEGTVELCKDGTTSPVQDTVALDSGDGLRTAADAKAVITLGNMGSVRLAPSTTLRLLAVNRRDDSGQLDVKLELASGSAWVEESNGVRASMQAGNALIVPMGTTYEVSMPNGGNPTVNVWEGQVRMSAVSNQQTVANLTAGQQAELANNDIKTGPINSQLAQANAFTAWNFRLPHPMHPLGRGPLLPPHLGTAAIMPSFLRNAPGTQASPPNGNPMQPAGGPPTAPSNVTPQTAPSNVTPQVRPQPRVNAVPNGRTSVTYATPPPPYHPRPQPVQPASVPTPGAVPSARNANVDATDRSWRERAMERRAEERNTPPQTPRNSPVATQERPAVEAHDRPYHPPYHPAASSTPRENWRRQLARPNSTPNAQARWQQREQWRQRVESPRWNRTPRWNQTPRWNLGGSNGRRNRRP